MWIRHNCRFSFAATSSWNCSVQELEESCRNERTCPRCVRRTRYWVVSFPRNRQYVIEARPRNQTPIPMLMWIIEQPRSRLAQMLKFVEHTTAWPCRETCGHRCTFAIGQSIDWPTDRPFRHADRSRWSIWHYYMCHRLLSRRDTPRTFYLLRSLRMEKCAFVIRCKKKRINFP